MPPGMRAQLRETAEGASLPLGTLGMVYKDCWWAWTQIWSPTWKPMRTSKWLRKSARIEWAVPTPWAARVHSIRESQGGPSLGLSPRVLRFRLLLGSRCAFCMYFSLQHCFQYLKKVYYHNKNSSNRKVGANAVIIIDVYFFVLQGLGSFKNVIPFTNNICFLVHDPRMNAKISWAIFLRQVKWL